MRGFFHGEVGGNVGHDPDLRSMPDGSPVSSFVVAVNPPKKQGAAEEPKADWIRVVCYGGLAEVVNKYVKKGSVVFAEGRVRLAKWVNREGERQAMMEVIARTVEFGGLKKVEDGHPYDQTDSVNQNNSVDEDVPF